jgi:hypothetical protein
MAIAASPAFILVYIIGVTNTSVMLTIPGINISISVVTIAAFLLGFFLLSALPVSFQMAMETKGIGPKLAGLSLGGLFTFGNLGGTIGPFVMEFFETSSLPYALSQWIYLQNYITIVSHAWWFTLIPSTPINLPGTFYLAILFLVIVGLAAIAAVAFLKDTHAESKIVETKAKAKTKA